MEFIIRPPYLSPDRGILQSKVTIHDAIAAGLPLNAAELESGLNDPDAWSQEYLCEFMDTSTVMFPYDLIAPCESSDATEMPLTPTQSGQLFAGIDFGRKHHLTVCWILERIPTLSALQCQMTHARCSMLNGSL
jgi:phage FluMu gp28-like protein